MGRDEIPTHLLDAIDREDDLLRALGESTLGREVADFLKMVFWAAHNLHNVKSERWRGRDWVEHHELEGGGARASPRCR